MLWQVIREEGGSGRGKLVLAVYCLILVRERCQKIENDKCNLEL